MNNLDFVRVIWYNTSSSSYQSGTWNDFNQLITSSAYPNEIQPLERFSDASARTLRKIVNELNKCKPKHLR